MDVRLTTLAFVTLAACSTSPSVSPAAPPPSPPVAQSPAPEQSAPSRAPADDHEDEHPDRWWTPLPAVSLEQLDPTEIEAVERCIDPYRDELMKPEVSADTLLAAAQCYGEGRLYGKEIRLYSILLDTRSEGDFLPEVYVRLGARYEQIGRPYQAAQTYDEFLKKYSKHENAQAVAKRAVCLARSDDDDETVEQLLSWLKRTYGRKGYVEPPPEAFEQLCAGVPAASG